jgi:hypothetical protein
MSALVQAISIDHETALDAGCVFRFTEARDVPSPTSVWTKRTSNNT